MRRTLQIFILLLSCVTWLFAAKPYAIHGTYRVVSQDKTATGYDAVILVPNLDAASIEYKGAGEVSWREQQSGRPARVVAKGRGMETYANLNEGKLTLCADGQEVAAFYIIDYRKYAPNFHADSLYAVPSCDEIALHFRGDLPTIEYITTADTSYTVKRQAYISYQRLYWDETNWVDSLVTVAMPIPNQTNGEYVFHITDTCAVTTFTLKLDTIFTDVATDSIVSEECTPFRVYTMPRAIVTKRGNSIENEPSRPFDEELLASGSYSAPVEIHFLSNANKPIAKYFKWRIYKGTQLIAERFDEEQRYTFTTNGQYQVKCWAYNDECPAADSTVFDISVSESLLKVPNVFTPNGDGVNDEFRVVYRSLAEFHCWIYNRWGHLVYEWSDPAKGWDGTINGKPAAEGAYYYIIRARGTDANANDKYHRVTKRKPADIGVYQMSGHINIIRGKE